MAGITRFKICCIQNIEEASFAIRCGASALGLVSEMPSGPGAISEEEIAEIAARVPPGVDSFLLTSRQDAFEIIEQHHRCRTSAIQLVDRLTSGGYKDLRSALRGVRLIQVIHVVDRHAVEEAKEAAFHVDAILLDSGNPDGAIKELGGTGRVHDWQISRKIVESIDKPVFLAGGLNPDNLADAIRSVQPFAVDVCTGVRTDGKLDEKKLDRFVRRLQRISFQDRQS